MTEKEKENTLDEDRTLTRSRASRRALPVIVEACKIVRGSKRERSEREREIQIQEVEMQAQWAREKDRDSSASDPSEAKVEAIARIRLLPVPVTVLKKVIKLWKATETAAQLQRNISTEIRSILVVRECCVLVCLFAFPAEDQK
jgi:hypothetical protein